MWVCVWPRCVTGCVQPHLVGTWRRVEPEEQRGLKTKQHCIQVAEKGNKFSTVLRPAILPYSQFLCYVMIWCSIKNHYISNKWPKGTSWNIFSQSSFNQLLVSSSNRTSHLKEGLKLLILTAENLPSMNEQWWKGTLAGKGGWNKGMDQRNKGEIAGGTCCYRKAQSESKSNLTNLYIYSYMLYRVLLNVLRLNRFEESWVVFLKEKDFSVC